MIPKDRSQLIPPMNRQKVEENVAKFVAIGFRRAGELINGYPLVYRMQPEGELVICREIYIVSEEVSPESRLPAPQSPGNEGGSDSQ